MPAALCSCAFPSRRPLREAWLCLRGRPGAQEVARAGPPVRKEGVELRMASLRRLREQEEQLLQAAAAEQQQQQEELAGGLGATTGQLGAAAEHPAGPHLGPGAVRGWGGGCHVRRGRRQKSIGPLYTQAACSHTLLSLADGVHTNRGLARELRAVSPTGSCPTGMSCPTGTSSLLPADWYSHC